MSVRLRGLGRRYGQQAAVQDIELDLGAGEFLALVGPSGAGKTTLLRMIAGLEPATAGRVEINGRDVTGVPARARNIGFMFQNYALFPGMSVAENVAFGLRVRPRATRPSRRAIRDKVAELLTLVQVPELANRSPAQLSGGQRQRVALARTLATEPDLLLLDEPFGALDPVVRKQIRGWLRDMQRRLGLTSILVTHDQAEATELADRVAVLRAGRLEQVASPDELEARPANPFVMGFLGEAVTFPASVRDGRLLPEEPGLLPFATALPAGPVLAGIRPYEIGLVTGGDGRVLTARLHGAHAEVAVRVGPREVTLLLPRATELPTPGSPVSLEVSAARVFPAPGNGAPASSAPA